MSATTTTGGSVGPGRVCDSLDNHVDRPFQCVTMIQGVVVTVVKGSFKTCHDIGGLVVIYIGLAYPRKVRGVDITARGLGGARTNVGMGGIFTEAAEECIPAVEAFDHINDTGGDLAREIREMGGEPVHHQLAEEGLRDGIAKATKFCDRATDTRTVLHNGFRREHTSLTELSEYGHHSSTVLGLVSVQ
jgi:hypothetical protein